MAFGGVMVVVGARVFVASATRMMRFEVAPKGLCRGVRPRRLRRQFGDAAEEVGEAGLVGEGARLHKSERSWSSARKETASQRLSNRQATVIEPSTQVWAGILSIPAAPGIESATTAMHLGR